MNLGWKDRRNVVPRGGGERVPIPESRLEMKTPLPRGAEEEEGAGSSGLFGEKN